VQNPARGLTLAGQPFTFSPVFMATLGALGQRLPETASRYLNLGPIRQRGIELSLDHRFSGAVAAFANYSYQRTPEVLTPKSGQLPYFASEVGIPARDRFNAGVNVNTRRFLAHASVNYTGEAYWVEVLAPLFAGATDSFAQVNASFGVKWMDGRLTTTVKAVNLLNEEIRQHVYGDLTRLNLVFEARLFVK
jgi:outer membrane receptor protein involved in Fe transport